MRPIKSPIEIKMELLVKNNVRINFFKKTLVFVLVFQLFTISESHGLFGPKSGSTCSNLNEVKEISSKKHICSEAKDKKLRWLLNSAPTDKNSALALILDSCGMDLPGGFSVYVFPRMMFGALAARGIADGSYKPTNMSSVDYDIERSARITRNLEMAAALDSKWKRISSLWNSGIDSAYSRWLRGGVTQIEAINSSSNNLDSIDGLCKVALNAGKKEANKENRNLSAWIARVMKDFN
jgi:hypothetical protein